MAANLTTFDAALASDMIFSFRSPIKGGDDSSSSSMAGRRIKFQFPPRILSDNRKGEWVEGPIRGDEPVAVYGTSGARAITMQWTYIAGARGPDGFLFKPIDVARQVRNMRSYFSVSRNANLIDDTLIVNFRMWYHTGWEQFTCRIVSVDVSHGKALVNDTGPMKNREEKKLGSGNSYSVFLPPNTSLNVNPRRTYALRTDITAEIRLWTRVGAATKGLSEEEREGFAVSDIGGKVKQKSDEKIAFDGLKSDVPADWQ
jgi:hypothetical protein